MACLFGHKWEGCVCRRCGVRRDAGHRFQKENCVEKCTRCGKTLEHHVWKHFACEVCKRPAPKPLLPALGVHKKGNSTYEGYRADTAEKARHFLSCCTVTEPLYYIVVHTPEGTWGLDREGMYLEELQPFQTDLTLAECEGSCAIFGAHMRMFNVYTTACGLTDNFADDVRCGSCGHEWVDGIRYQDKTVVRCPKCYVYNLVDSTNIQVVSAQQASPASAPS